MLEFTLWYLLALVKFWCICKLQWRHIVRDESNWVLFLKLYYIYFYCMNDSLESIGVLLTFLKFFLKDFYLINFLKKLIQMWLKLNKKYYVWKSSLFFFLNVNFNFSFYSCEIHFHLWFIYVMANLPIFQIKSSLISMRRKRRYELVNPLQLF